MTKLITNEQRAQLLANGWRSQADSAFDPAPVVKLFTPAEPDHAFGLCDLGLGYPELVWVSLEDITTVRGKLGLTVERDLHFRTDKRLSAFAREARLVGRIVV